MENTDDRQKNNGSPVRVLTVQFIVCALLFVLVWMCVRTDNAVGRFVRAEYSSLTADDITPQEAEDAFNDAAGYVRTFSQNIVENIKEESTVPAVPAGGEDVVISDLSALEGVSFDKYDLGFDIVCPVDDYFVSSPFGYRENPLSDGLSIHTGTDMAASYASPIYCAWDGTVRKTDYSDGYGNYIVVTHDGGYETLYAHCSEIIAGAGDEVKGGDVIAEVGSTGNSTGNHLHFEIRLNGIKLDPAYALGL